MARTHINMMECLSKIWASKATNSRTWIVTWKPEENCLLHIITRTLLIMKQNLNIGYIHFHNNHNLSRKNFITYGYTACSISTKFYNSILNPKQDDWWPKQIDPSTVPGATTVLPISRPPKRVWAPASSMISYQNLVKWYIYIYISIYMYTQY
jgi:hypothetical protein